jgi:ubiquinone/menaquinone biosynthesis C-methylase UbiE
MKCLPGLISPIIAAVMLVLPVPASLAQEKSVRPGVNKSFEDPNPAEFVDRFEREGREIFDERAAIVAACKLKPGSTVADIGAGTGLFTRLFAARVGPRGRVYAVDIAKNFIDHIDKTAAESGLKNVTGVVCRPDSVELPPDSIDVAFICDTYHHFEFPQKTMRSIHRALRPNGQLVLVEFDRIDGVSSDWVLGHVRAGQQTFTNEIVADGFRFVEEVKLMKESYFLRFAKVADSDPRPEPPAFVVDRLRGKRIIEWGWDEPDTKFMRENIERMEGLPFDGLVFHATSSKGGNFVWEMWGGRRFERAEFEQAIADLNATPFRRLADRFLRVNVTPGTVDWFDDAAWSVVLNNFQVAAEIASDGRTRGFMFDVEQYNSALFDYRKQPHRESRSFADYQAKVRTRGREWMKAVGKAFPDITILLTFGYSITQPSGTATDRSEAHYGLLADFLDGLLDACPDRAMIVDAWEQSYPYKRSEQFTSAYNSIRRESAAWSADAERYRRFVRAGFGVWMDYNWRKIAWDTEDFSRNHFTPAEFESAVRSALLTSDAYVWVYTEQPRWWTNERLPDPYVEALRRARERP